MALSSEFVIVRHAEAFCDIAGVVGGPHGDSGLTPAGRVQAAQAAACLAAYERPIAAVYSGPCPRLRQTGQIVAAVLGLRLRVHARLGEQRYGDAADGRAWSTVLEEMGTLPDYEPTRPLAEGGECWRSYVTRVRRALAALVARHPGECVVVIGTGGMVHASFELFLELPEGGTGRVGFECPPTAMTTWRESPASTHRPAVGLRWSLVGHLATLRNTAAIAG
jgi:probable phosphoglycerate mutase